jgi:uncharacterized protein (TIGR02284 family)
MSTITTSLAASPARAHKDVQAHPLRELIQVNLESARDFQDAAEAVRDRVLQQRFLEWAAQRVANAARLEEALEQGAGGSGGSTFLAGMRQWWGGLRPRWGQAEPCSVLAQVARGEETVDRSYDRAIREMSASCAADLLARQAREIHQARKVIDDLRDLLEE